MSELPIECTNKWRPNNGDSVYIAHAITGGTFKKADFIRYWGGCLIVLYNNKLHRLHVRHSGMKPILRVNNEIFNA